MAYELEDRIWAAGDYVAHLPSQAEQVYARHYLGYKFFTRNYPPRGIIWHPGDTPQEGPRSRQIAREINRLLVGEGVAERVRAARGRRRRKRVTRVQHRDRFGRFS